VSKEFRIFAGTANPDLAAAIARELGVSRGACAIDQFPDGEVALQLLEPVRRKEVFLVQPTAPPVNDHLEVSHGTAMDLVAQADAPGSAPTTAHSRYLRDPGRRGVRDRDTSPPLKPEEIVIDATSDNLTVYTRPGQAESESNRRYVQRERQTEPLSRVFEFPEEIDTDNVQATLENGILKIQAPKAAVSRRKVIRLSQSA
jgi:hypothetical protein